MGCCLAVAFLMSLVRRVWLTIVPQSPAESALFATPAVRMGPSPADRHLPQVVTEAKRWVDVAKAVKPGEAEIGRNPRARSSILRVATRSAPSSWPRT